MFASNDTRHTRTIPPSAAAMARPKTRRARCRANARTGSRRESLMVVTCGRRDDGPLVPGCGLRSDLERVIADRLVQGNVVQRDRLVVAARKGHLHLDEQGAFTVN